MAHLVRPWIVRYVNAKGQRVKKGTPGAKPVKERARKWYGKGIPGLPKAKKVPLATDKNVARKMLQDLVNRGERGQARMPDLKQGGRPVADHLAEFGDALRAAGTASDRQVNTVLSRAGRVLEGCGFATVGEIDEGRVVAFLAELRKDCEPVALDPAKEWYTRPELAALLDTKPGNVSALVRRHRLPAVGSSKARRYSRVTAEFLCRRQARGASAQTSNFYLAAVSQFCHWLVAKGRLDRNPVARAPRSNIDLDRRHDRRDLQPDELARVLDAARQSPVSCRGLDGPQRFFLYCTACGTGFRSDELAALTPEAFALDADPPTVTLGATQTKNKKVVVQPLPASLAAVIAEYLKGRPRRQPLWPGGWHEKGAEMLRIDLEAAGVPYEVPGPDGPLYADFHALRHTYITMMDRAGVSPKAAQELARHADVQMTIGRYSHATLQALGDAVNRLPLPVPGGVAVNPLQTLPRAGLEALALVGLVLWQALLAPAHAARDGAAQDQDQGPQADVA